MVFINSFLKIYVGQLRIKIITFGDYLTANKDNPAIKESIFFELPRELYEQDEYLNNIRLNKQSSEKTNGLEALYLAMHSDFIMTSRFDRQIIFLITGNDALPLQERANCPGYPTDMPKDIEELATCWMSGQAKPFSLNQKIKRTQANKVNLSIPTKKFRISGNREKCSERANRTRRGFLDRGNRNPHRR